MITRIGNGGDQPEERAQQRPIDIIQLDSAPRADLGERFSLITRDAIAAIVLFVVPTIGFKLVYGLAICISAGATVRDEPHGKSLSLSKNSNVAVSVKYSAARERHG